MKETSNNMLLITLYNLHTTILHIPGYKLKHFAKTPFFFPLGIAELPNRNIVIGGPTHLCGNKCKDDDCVPSEVEHTEIGRNASVSRDKEKRKLFQPLYNA
jgi:hypothetical protein